MANFTDPIKAAFGRYLYGFRQQLIADTPALTEFTSRQYSKSVVIAPGRMIDQVNEMLEAWRKDNHETPAGTKPYLPVMIVAVSKDFIPAPPDFGRHIPDAIDVMIPGDAKERVFKMRTVVADVRVQVAICAPEEPTAKSIALQLHLWATSMENRRFKSIYKLVGQDEQWPVVLEFPDIQAVSMPTDQKNITILTAEFQARATVPLLSRPKGAEPNDGKGDGSEDDPDGYLVVVTSDITVGNDPLNAETVVVP